MGVRGLYLRDPWSVWDVGGLVLIGLVSGRHWVGRGSPRGSLGVPGVLKVPKTS